MAGIGFRLKKIIGKERLSSLFEASITGAFIVAGPWLLSILILSVISAALTQSSSAIANDFFAILVYIFALSLILTGGSHYIFTRIFSDYVFEDRINESLYLISLYLIFTSTIISVLSFLISALLYKFTLLFSLQIFLLTFVTNSLWIILIFVSFLKWYLKILTSFLIGLLVITVLIVLKGDIKINYLLFSYSIGNLIIFLSLYYISYKEHKPKKVINVTRIIKSYWKNYKYLFFTGMLYYLAIWIDKILYWIYMGESSGSLNLHVFYTYDISIYLANLSIIPGLVVFIISTETSYFIEVKKFLISLSISDYKVIELKRNRILKDSKRWITNQTVNQLMVVVAFSLISPLIIKEYYVLIIALWSIFFLLMVFTYLSYLFYIDRYRDSFLSMALMVSLNVLFFYILNFVFELKIPGISYLLSTVITTFYIRNRYIKAINRLDRYIYTGNFR